jgi:hypothetical protein
MGKLCKILLIEHPKCGRLWVQNLLQTIDERIRVDMTHAKSAGVNRTYERPVTPAEYFDSLHETIGYKKRKKIFLYRDPRDVMVSFYHQIKYKCMRPKVDVTLAIDIPTFIRSIYGIEYLLKFYQLWENYDAIHVSYEDLRKDTLSTLKNILNYVGFLIDEEKILYSIEYNSFERTRDREMEEKPSFHNHQYHAREGKVGGYENYMSNEDIEYCNSMIKKYPSKFVKGVLNG